MATQFSSTAESLQPEAGRSTAVTAQGFASTAEPIKTAKRLPDPQTSSAEPA